MRGDFRTICVVAIAVALAVLTLWRVPGAFRRANDQFVANSKVTEFQRQIAPARSVDIDGIEIFVVALRIIPRTATFYVALGSGVRVSTPGVLNWVRHFAVYWLLPRRMADDAAAADWVISYGGDLEALGLRYRRTVEVEPGYFLAEVER